MTRARRHDIAGSNPSVVVLVLANALRHAGGRQRLDKDTVVQVYGVSPATAEQALRQLGAPLTRRPSDQARAATAHTLGPGERVYARQATRAERAALRLAWSEPVLVVVRADGEAEIFPADTVEVCGPELPA